MSRTDKAMKVLQLPVKQNINAKIYVNTIKIPPIETDVTAATRVVCLYVYLLHSSSVADTHTDRPRA